MEHIISESAQVDLSESSEHVRRLDELADDEIKAMNDDKGCYLQINAYLAFNLDSWYNSEARTNNRYPAMPKKQQELFDEDIASSGVFVRPVLNASSYEVVDGRTRLGALYRARITGIACPFVGFELWTFSGQQEREDFEDQIALNIRPTMTRAQKRAKITDAIMRHPDWADNKIGLLVGADGDTVGAVSDQLIAEGKIVRPSERLGSDGRVTKKKTKKSQPEESADCPEARLFRRWREEVGIYPLNAKEIGAMMLREGVPLGIKTEPTEATLASFAGEIGKWIRRRVQAGLTSGGWHLYERQFGDGRFVFAFVPPKFRIPELERLATESGSGEEGGE